MDRTKLTNYIKLRRAQREDLEILWKYFEENRYVNMLYEAYDFIEADLGLFDYEEEAITWHFIGNSAHSDFKTDEELIDWILNNPNR